MNDEATLLRAYAEEGSETAFADLVRRHVDLVYGAAMRRTGGDAHMSADVAQQVFTAMARHARELAGHSALGAWLHTATRNAALKAMIAEQRRRARETAAADPAQAGPAVDLDWEQLRPLLDEVIDELPEPDRASLVMRFFERRQFADIGSALQVSEDAARMRTERALDKLRDALSRRGVTSTAAAVAAAVSSQPLVSAPAGLATTIAAQSLAAEGGGALTAVGSMLTAKIALAVTVGAVVAFMVGGFVGVRWNAGSSIAGEIPDLERTIATLRSANGRLESDLRNRSDEVAALKEKNSALEEEQTQAVAAAAATSVQTTRKNPTIGLARYEVQQAVLSNLRQIAAARHQYILDKGHEPANVQELVGRGGYIRTVRTVGGEDYSALPMGDTAEMTVTTPDGVAVTFDPSGTDTTKPDVPPEVARVEELGRKVGPTIDKAVAAYRAANNGANPPNEQALLPFFTTPQEGADFVEFLEARKAGGGGP